ncbi:MAG TPA: DUF4294 domain-containing protein [Flavobacteriaceae bacterium]|nr:DUF4294 domain-containing protein [Flavobacteriaceae bacterium]
MKEYIYIGVLVLFFGAGKSFSQERETDSTSVFYYIIEGDTIPRDIIDLEEVYLLPKLYFNSDEAKRKYLILRRKTRKVYPYAKLAADRLVIMNERLESIKRKRDKKIYTKRMQDYVEKEFSEQLKQLTRSEGQILVKLIHRQTGETAFDLVKELRTGWRAFWYNVTANMFDISLKQEFRPAENIEDYLIEDILQRAFQEGALENQPSAFPINMKELNLYWRNKNVDNSN